MRRTAGALAIGAAVSLFLASVLPYVNVPGKGTLHRLTALGGQPLRDVVAMAIFHWTPVLILAFAGVWLMLSTGGVMFPAGVVAGIGAWESAAFVASLIAQQDLLVGAWFDLAGMLLAAAAAILCARIAYQATRIRPPSLPPKPEIQR